MRKSVEDKSELKRKKEKEESKEQKRKRIRKKNTVDKRVMGERKLLYH